MIPIHLSLSGFLSYRDIAEVDFTSFDLACISGANGAGKSSLLDGVTWALFGQARKRDDSVINTQCEVAEVNFTFGYEGNLYRVQRVKPRGKTTLLEFHIQTPAGHWKPLTERTLRDTEGRIQHVLRLDYETFVNASFFLQGKADQFTQQRPGDRKRILGSILGLEVWEQLRRGAVERRKVVDDEISTLDGRMEEINAELGLEEQRKGRLKELEAELERLSKQRAAQETTLEEMRRRSAALEEQGKLVATLAEQVERAEGALNELEGRLKERQEEQASFNEIVGRAEEIQASYEEWQTAREELARWEEIAGQFRKQEERRREPMTEIERERARLEAEREGLTTEKAKVLEALAQVGDLEKQLEAAKDKVDEANTLLKERAALEERLKTAQQEQADAKAENPRLKAQMDELKQRIEQLERTDGAVCPVCGQTLSPEEREKLIGELNGEGKAMGDRYRANQALLKEANTRVSEVEGAITKLSQADELLRDHTRTADQLSAKLEQAKQNEAAWKSNGAQRLKEIERGLKNEDYATAARKTLAEIDSELKEIGYDAASHDAARKREEEKRNAEVVLRELEQAQATLAPLGREIGELGTQIKKQGEEIERQRKGFDEAAAKLAAAQAEAPDIAGSEREMLSLKEIENKLRLEVGAARQEVLVLDDLKRRKTELTAQREGLARKREQFKSLERAFGKDGVPAMLIEQALPQIESKANEILGRLTDDKMFLSFVTQQAYKDRKRDDLRETLDIQISDSAGVRDYEMFSGGEAFRINFAIRLALSEVLAQRAGARLQTLVIDEGFGSQDELGRQRLVEAINLVRSDFEKILVITHIEALKDAFPQRIEVEKTPRGSVAQVV